MSHAGIKQTLGHAHPDCEQALQDGRLLQIVADKLVEQETFHPFHLQNRIPLPSNTDALLEVREIHRKRQFDLAQMLANGAIALLKPCNVSREALDSPF